MKDCIFCKIANKEIPAHIVYEDENFMAFLDVDPQSPGHCQIIPKKHYPWVWDLPSDTDKPASAGATAGKYFEVARKVALAQRKAFNTEWILSKIIGDEVPHAHIWVFPRNGGGNKKDFEENARKIQKYID